MPKVITPVQIVRAMTDHSHPARTSVAPRDEYPLLTPCRGDPAYEGLPLAAYVPGA
ncbi:hypothetical protein SAMN05428938_8074 [Streptomyces sp. KS_5]|nr:hypothetical protein SAMN05428938_8074 [Streptomyces sp. KS_5]